LSETTTVLGCPIRLQNIMRIVTIVGYSEMKLQREVRGTLVLQPGNTFINHL